MGDVIEFTKGKRKHNKALEKRIINKKKKKKVSIAAKLIGITLFFSFIMLQGTLSMGTTHVVALSIFIVFWVSIFALSSHFVITSHYGIASPQNNRT